MSERSAFATLLPASLLDALRQRSLASPPRTAGLRHGEHRSQRAGLGLEFRDHRPYVAGDDLRRLDWRAAARQDRLILRQQEAEEELTATVVLDGGGNMLYGDGDTNKWRHAVAITAAIAFVAGQQHDRWRFVVGHDGLLDDAGLAAATRREQQRRVVEACERPPAGHCPWVNMIERVAALPRRRGAIFVISDLLDLAATAEDDPEQALHDVADKLAVLAARGQHVTLVQLLHRDEIRFPWPETKVYRFEDLTGRRRAIEGVAAQLGEGFDERVAAYLRRLDRLALERGLSILRLMTDNALPDNVLRVFGGAGVPIEEARA